MTLGISGDQVKYAPLSNTTMATPLAPIGIVLVTHERLGEAFIESVTHILGARPLAIESVCSHQDRRHQQLHSRLSQACRQVDRGRGVLLLVDVFGATPANFCSDLIDDRQVSAIAGVNLPLLLRAINYRNDHSLAELVEILNTNHNELIRKLSRRPPYEHHAIRIHRQ